MMAKTKAELDRVLSNPVEFIKRLKIIDKSGKLINLKPNSEQIKIIEALETGEPTLILKGRQIGSSTIVAAFFFWKIYTSKEPTTFAILSHKLHSAKHLLSMHKTFYDNLPKFLQKEFEVNNTTELKFKDSGAKIIAVSAGADGGIRSFTCSYLHMSEYAFSPNPEELKATALNALNDGQLVIESTANYFNDALHQEWIKWTRGEVHWKALFFPWFSHDEYSLDVKGDILLSEDEEAIKAKYGLTNSQLAWRRERLSKIGLDKFKREFPASIDDAYSQTGNVYFKEDDFKDINLVPVEPVEFTRFSKVDKDDAYAIGVDVAAGVNRDYSVIYVVSKKTYNLVAIYRSRLIVPTALAARIQEIAKEYNSALVLVESNNFGNVVLNELRHLGYYNIWQQDGRDWITTSKSKTEMFEGLKEVIQSGYITWLDMITYQELRALQLTDKGGIELPQNMDSHADSALAMALAYVCIKKVNLKIKPYLPDWIGVKRTQKVLQTTGAAVGMKSRY
jgi:hypothetical protein